MPTAFRTMRVDADLVITSHHAFANRVRVPAHATVVSYTHTPARWIWDRTTRRGEFGGAIGAAALATFSATQRRADRAAARRVDHILVNSTAVAERVRSWWGREATVVHPPVDTAFYAPDDAVDREDFFLLAGRLVPYKRPEVGVLAAERAGVPLVVAGDGRARAAVESVRGPHTRILGAVGDEELRTLYQRCRALVFPGVEDFGIVPVEAMACGAPVIAVDAGGARDTVIPGCTGVRIPAGTDDAVVDAFATTLRRWDDGFDAAGIRRHAEGFSAAVFRDRIRAYVDDMTG
jgi:glycosyltransferase involved in cell wall biosynthesis